MANLLQSMQQLESLPTKAELLKFFSSLTKSELEELDQLLLSIQEPWLPQPGPQTAAYYSLADELYYGGSAGGGKTDLLLGLAATAHVNSIIWRREYPQLDSIVDRSHDIFDGRGNKFNAAKLVWKHDRNCRKLELRAMQYQDDAKKFQGRPHDLKAYDEITHFTKFQYVFTKAWNRTVIPKQRCRIVAAGNPPTDVEGRWVIDYWAPWLDDTYHNPAKAGELRHFISVAGKDFEVEGKGRFKFRGQVYESRSRTFLPSSLQDNLFLANTDYRATLDALPEPLRSQLLNGDFMAGVQDDAQQVFPTSWVKQAQARWRERANPKGPANQLGLDIARGGSDRTVSTPRWGNYFGEQKILPGAQSKTGLAVCQWIAPSCGAQTIVAADVIGVGSSPFDFMTELKFKAVPLQSAATSIARDRSGMLGFVNQRAEWHWKLREALDPEQGDDLAIPDDPELLADLCAIKWKLTLRGIQIESKDDIKERLLRSPDKGESLIYASASSHLPGQALLDYLEDDYTRSRNEAPAVNPNKHW